MQLRDMLQLAGGEEAAIMREGCRQFGTAFDPQLCQGLVVGAALGLFDLDGDSSSSGSSNSNSSAAALAAGSGNSSSSAANLAAGSGSSGSSSGQQGGLFIQTGAMRPAAAATSSSAGVQGSSSSSKGFGPYRQALDSEAVDLSIAEPLRVSGDIAGQPMQMVVDIGCGHSVIELETAQFLVEALSQGHCPCELISFDEALRVGMFAGPVQVPTTHVLRNVPVGLGPGVYLQHFLVMPKANFNITLGLDFCNAYNAQIVSRSFRDRTVGAALKLPVPPQVARRGWRPPPPPRHIPQHLRASWIFTSHIPGHYLVHRHRCRGTRVPLEALLALKC
jgi:hypothetical protein